MTTTDLLYKRMLLKLSGEALMGEGQYGIDIETVKRIALDVAEAVRAGAEICIVVGGGNIFRGLSGAAQGMDRANADYMGMLATVMNGLALQNAFHSIQLDARVMSAIPMPTVCEPFIRPQALRHLEKGRVVIFVAGSGNPYFTTDTASTLRAAEMECNVLAKATQVDGVYTADPKKDPNAERYQELTLDEVLAKNLKIMDGAAIALARDNKLPILVFSIWEKGNILKVLQGKGLSTLVRAE
ncbi:MAG: UMP kinase [Pseudomonadota bacterium]